MTDIPGKFVGMMLAILLCIIGPSVNIMSQQEMLARRQIITEMTNFLDDVVDSRAYYPSMRKELAARLNAYGVMVKFRVVKEQRSIDAAVVASDTGLDSVEGSANVTYISVPLDAIGDNETIHFSTGDRVGLEVQGISYTGTQYIVHNAAGLFLPKFQYQFYARVR